MQITTQRLTLRPFCPTDARDVIALMRDPCVGKTYMVPDLSDDAAAQRLFTRLHDLSHDDSRVVLAAALDGRVIGLINDVGIQGRRIELGYAFAPAYHGQGYATEAVSALIGALFACGFEEVVAGAFEHNAASLRVMEKCGMTRIDLTEDIEYRGKTYRCVYCELTRP